MQIDKDNSIVGFWGDAIKNLSKEQYLHHFFMIGNCFTSPGMTMKRSDFGKILYPLDTAMCNLQDMQIHIKLLLNAISSRGGGGKDLIFLDENLVLYRNDPRTANISARTENAIKRESMEQYKLMDTFLEIKNIAKPEELLRKIFFEEIKRTDIFPNTETLEYFLGRMALLSPISINKMWGYHKIMESYASKEGALKLKRLYNFEFKDYLNLIEEYKDISEEVERAKYVTIQYKYKKYKRLFNIAVAVSILALLIVFMCYFGNIL